MNKADLVAAMARHLGSTKAEAERALDAFTGCVATGLRQGEVSIVGFGSFRAARRAARIGRHPRTHQPLEIGPSLGISFRPGKSLKDSVSPFRAARRG
jgi:DNA-binding protein HU-beta